MRKTRISFGDVAPHAETLDTQMRNTLFDNFHVALRLYDESTPVVLFNVVALVCHLARSKKAFTFESELSMTNDILLAQVRASIKP